MGYKLLGMAVWHGGRWYLRRRYGPHVGAKLLVAGGVIVAGAALVVVATRRNGD